MTTTEEIRAMDERIVAQQLVELRWEAMEREIPLRLEAVCADAVESAPAVATWWSGRLALSHDRGRRAIPGVRWAAVPRVSDDPASVQDELDDVAIWLETR